MKIGRRTTYLVLLVAISLPKIFSWSLPNVRMPVAEKSFQIIDRLEENSGKLVFLSLDFGPSTLGENRPQSEIVIEHLLRKRIPFVVFSAYHLSKVFLEEIPQSVAERLNQEAKGSEKWSYGKDWVNLGYRPGDTLLLQAMAKSKNLLETWGSDARGNRLQDLSALKGVKGFESITHVVEITGLTSVLERYINYFKSDKHSPIFIHGCTSIAIPQAYIYLDSGQLKGLLEGVAGAAWYAETLGKTYKLQNTPTLEVTSTMISVAHLVLIFFIILGNIVYFRRHIKAKHA